MALTSDNIKIVKQFADKLEEWVMDLSYSTYPIKNFFVELNLFFYPQDLQDTVSWLVSIPAIGQRVRKDFKELLKMVQKEDPWRIQGMYHEKVVEFGALINRLKEVAFNIFFILREIHNASKLEPPVSEALIVEKSNTSEMRETKPIGIGLAGIPAKLSRKEALMAYKLHYEMGLTQPQIAKRMTGELELDKPVRQWEVSRRVSRSETGI